MPAGHTVHRTPWATLIVVGTLLIAYVLSYAPVYRVGKEYGWASPYDPLAAYRPVDWLIDETPLAEPLYIWADCWRVRGDFVWAAAARAFDVGEDSHIISTEAETPHLYEHVDVNR